MPESPTSSFIPKRGVGKKITSPRKSNFILLPIISYALFVSAPLASAAIFIYERHTQNQFNKAVVNLDLAIENFKEEDLKRVTDFNERLSLTKKLLEAHVSMVQLLKTIETSTAETVKFESMDITRVDISTISVKSLLSTSEFDGALFQRSAYDAAEIISNPLFSGVTLLQAAPKKADDDSSDNGERSVEFQVAFDFAASDIRYKSSVENTTQAGDAADATSSSTTSSVVGESETESATESTQGNS